MFRYLRTLLWGLAIGLSQWCMGAVLTFVFMYCLETHFQDLHIVLCTFGVSELCRVILCFILLCWQELTFAENYSCLILTVDLLVLLKDKSPHFFFPSLDISIERSNRIFHKFYYFAVSFFLRTSYIMLELC